MKRRSLLKKGGVAAFTSVFSFASVASGSRPEREYPGNEEKTTEQRYIDAYHQAYNPFWDAYYALSDAVSSLSENPDGTGHKEAPSNGVDVPRARASVSVAKERVEMAVDNFALAWYLGEGLHNQFREAAFIGHSLSMDILELVEQLSSELEDATAADHAGAAEVAEEVAEGMVGIELGEVPRTAVLGDKLGVEPSE